MNTNDHELPGKPVQREIRLRIMLFNSPEGRILLTGLVLAFLYVVWLGFSYLSSPEEFQVFVGMTATHVLFGRAAGMSFGYALNFGHDIVVPVNMTIETIMVLLFYPLFVFSWRHLVMIRILENLMGRIHKTAEANRDNIKRYGLLGLFVFVFFPFWMTGPLVGSAIGFLLGLRSWVNMSVVLGGTYVATLVWAVILKGLHARVAAYSPFAPMILVAIVILVVVVSYVLEWKRSGNDASNK